MKRKQPNIKFDFDGSLVDWATYFRKWVESKRFTIVDNGSFYWELLDQHGSPVSHEAASRLVYRSMSHIEEFEPMDGAELFLGWYYAQTGVPIQVVTCRPHHVAGYTHQVFARLFPHIPFTISFVDDAVHKPLYMEDCTVFYDDRRKTAVEMAGRGFTVFMPVRDYNFPIRNCEVPVVRLNKLDPEASYHPDMLIGGRIILVDSIADLTDKRIVNLLFR